MKANLNPLRSLSKIAAVFIGVGLVVAIVYLVIAQYRSQVALQQTALKQVTYDSERRATALGYFFSEQQDYMRELADSREISVYFENKALGMSMEYGLRASILIITEHFDLVRQAKKLGGHSMYERIVFIDTAGRLLNDSRSPDQLWSAARDWREFLSPKNTEPVILRDKDKGNLRIIISAPSFFKGRYVGQVMGWISFPQIYHYFFESEQESSRFSDAIIYRNEYLHIPIAAQQLIAADSPSIPADIKPGQPYPLRINNADFEGKTSYAILVPVKGTSFSLMTVIPPTGQFDFRSPRQLLITTGGLALFIIAGMIFLVRQNTRNALLKAHLEETLLRESAVDAKNRELAAEIMERQLAEDSLQKERDFVESLFETAQVIMLVLDNEGRVERFNPYMEAVSGYRLDEVRGKDWFSVFLPEGEKEGLRAIFRATLHDSTARSITYPIVTKDNRMRDIEWYEKILLDADGSLQGLLSIGQDITNRKILEEELLKTEKLESLGVLAGGIAHDFNNLLTAILGNISLAMMQADPAEKIYQWLTNSEKASIRAQDLTQQLLTFSKGSTPIKMVSSIGSIIRDSASFVMSGSNVRCEFIMPPDLWQVEIDSGQISQVIHNLFINANQAMPDGGVIRTLCENVAIEKGDALPLKAGRYLKISISDQGSGIPEENLAKIFDPYFTTKKKGSGLGLASCFSIVKQHDGLISVESVVGSGTTFHVFLPSTTKELPQESARKETPYLAKGKILVMDDDEAVRDVIGEMLRSSGYEVEFALGGAQAIAMYREAMVGGSSFDLVVMDLTIPGEMGGKEAIRILKESDSHIKAIVSSGYSNDPVMANFREYGFMGIINKPYRITELVDTLRMVLTDEA
jgi:PAS domain S-box-containing protein